MFVLIIGDDWETPAEHTYLVFNSVAEANAFAEQLVALEFVDATGYAIRPVEIPSLYIELVRDEMRVDVGA